MPKDPNKTAEQGGTDATARQIAAIVMSSDDAIVAKNLDGIITFWNRGAELLFGYTAAEMVGKSVQILLPPERQHEEYEILDRLRKGERVQFDEAIRRRKDGSLVDVPLTISPIKDASGRIVGASKIAHNITERKQQAERLKRLAQDLESQAKLFDATLSNITDLAYSFDLQCRWIYANKPLLDLWGKSLEQISGKTCWELGYPPDLARVLEAQIQKVIATKRSVRGETPYVSGSGKLDDHEYIFSPVLDTAGNVTAVVGTTRLITERKKAEEELKLARDQAVAASRAKDEFLAALSHELRTPLNPILLVASAAASNPGLPSEVREDFELIRKNADLEARLIDDLLDVTRISHGKLALEQRSCDFQAILKDALANVWVDAEAKRLQLVVDGRAGDCFIWGDPIRLQQILWNVLKNAVKFTPEDGNIRVETSRDAQRVVVKVTDSGIGMNADEVARIFQAFTQGDHAVQGGKHRFGGLGLGLAISKRLVEMHGGRIHATSAGRDRGTTLTVEFPLFHPVEVKTGSAQAHDRPVASPPAPVGLATASGAAPTPVRILLVDDHAPTRQVLQRLLAQRQYDVTVAECAEQAVALARKDRFALVVSDVGLPDRSGYELMKELRTLDPAFRGIALSGYGAESDVAQSLAAGFDLHLVKPANAHRLLEAVAGLLSDKSGRP